jgi:hypothetical protein
MPDQNRSGDKFRDISAIDSRLAELDQERPQLIAPAEELEIQAPGSGNGMAGFRIAPEQTQSKHSDTMPASIFFSWYRCFLPR